MVCLELSTLIMSYKFATQGQWAKGKQLKYEKNFGSNSDTAVTFFTHNIIF